MITTTEKGSSIGKTLKTTQSYSTLDETSNYLRRNVTVPSIQQVDVCSVISHLLGQPSPTQSIGLTPLHLLMPRVPAEVVIQSLIMGMFD